ncbi:MAG: MarR family transcriptional regulator [Jatrophihabitans sp.]
MTSDPQEERLVLLWREIASAVQRTQRGIDQEMEGSGVSAQEFAVLNLLLHADDHRAPMNVLAREVSMTSGGFTKLADRMARDGLIDRRGSEADRRVIRAVLTAEGERRVRQAGKHHVRILQQHLLTALSLSDMSSIAEALRGLDPVEAIKIDAAENFAPASRRSTEPERRARRVPAAQ